MRTLILTVLLISPCLGAADQSIQDRLLTIPYDLHYRFGASNRPIGHMDGPWFLDLAGVDGERIGNVSLRETPDGIVIFGRIAGRPPSYAKSPDEINARDHMGLWLALSEDIEMPALGWGNQHGLFSCNDLAESPTAASETCQSWETEQLKYREQLRRLFVRHWQFAPSVLLETFASEAYDKLPAAAASNGLRPHGGPQMAASEGGEVSDFEILVRWGDFPPANDLNISKMFLALEFCATGRACASTSPFSAPGKLPILRQLMLERPRVSTLTPCNYSLQEADLFGNRYPAWYFLGDGGITDMFALENYVAGYQNQPDGPSPVVVWEHRFWKAIAKGEFVCGPDLRYVASKSYSTEDAPYKSFSVDERDWSTRRLTDGAHLLKIGPLVGTRSPLGTGRCGACYAVELAIYHLSPAAGITIALQIGLVIDAPNTADGDIVISPDWRTVTVFLASDDDNGKRSWTYQRYCLNRDTYEECANGHSIGPPKPRRLKFDN
jgi:hypothetical protein